MTFGIPSVDSITLASCAAAAFSTLPSWFRLEDDSGLAPLKMPEGMAQGAPSHPSADSIARFQKAMSRDSHFTPVRSAALASLVSAIPASSVDERIVPVLPEEVEFLAPTHFFTAKDGTILPYREHFPAAAVAESGKSSERILYPLVLFMHGAGTRGSDGTAFKNNISFQCLLSKVVEKAPDAIAVKQVAENMTPAVIKVPAIVIAPQCPVDAKWVDTPWEAKTHVYNEAPSRYMAAALELFERKLDALPVDHSRIYVCGNSMGGYATWDILCRCPDLFAAALPVCGGGTPERIVEVSRTTPILTVHGNADNTVPVENTRAIVEAVRADPAHIAEFHYIEKPGVGHDCWTATFSDPEIVNWLFSQKRDVDVEEPQTSKAVPVFTAPKTVVVEKPIIVAEAPKTLVMVEQPVATAERPAIVVEKPVVVAEAPKAPVVMVEQPVATAERTANVVEKPVVVAEAPKAPVVAETPVATAERTANVVEKPVVVAEAPKAPVVVEQPVIAPERTAMVVEKPVVVAEAPRVPVVAEHPVATAERTAVVVEKPVVVAEAPKAPVVAETPVATAERTAVVVEKPVVVAEAPKAPVVVEHPVATAERTAMVVEKPVVAEVRDVPTMRDASAISKTVAMPKTAAMPVLEETPIEPAGKDKAAVEMTAAIAAASAFAAPATEPVVAAGATDVAAISAHTQAMVDTVNEIVEAVAAQITVSPSIVKGEGEIKIHLKESVLDGSEIRLEAKGGTLTVEIVPATPAAEQTVVKTMPQLERALAEHIPAFSGFSIAIKNRGDKDETK